MIIFCLKLCFYVSSCFQTSTRANFDWRQPPGSQVFVEMHPDKCLRPKQVRRQDETKETTLNEILELIITDCRYKLHFIFWVTFQLEMKATKEPVVGKSAAYFFKNILFLFLNVVWRSKPSVFTAITFYNEAFLWLYVLLIIDSGNEKKKNCNMFFFIMIPKKIKVMFYMCISFGAFSLSPIRLTADKHLIAPVICIPRSHVFHSSISTS